MKKITAYEAADGSVHRTEKDAAVHDFKTQHAGVFGEDAVSMMLQRAGELGILLSAIGRGEFAPLQSGRARAKPAITRVAPAKDTKPRRQPSAGARKQKGKTALPAGMAA